MRSSIHLAYLCDGLRTSTEEPKHRQDGDDGLAYKHSARVGSSAGGGRDSGFGVLGALIEPFHQSLQQAVLHEGSEV